KRTIALTREGHLDEAMKIVRSDAGENLMDEIRHAIDEMAGTQETLLAVRRNQLRLAEQRIQWVMYFGVVLATLGAVLLIVTFAREQKRRAKATLELAPLKDAAEAANHAKSDFLATM